MTKNEIIAILSAIEGAVQIDSAEYAIPAETVVHNGETIQTYVGVKVATKRAVATEKLPAFDIDEAVAKWNEKCNAKAQREAEKANKPKADPETVQARNIEMMTAINTALSAEDDEGNAVKLNADEIRESCGWGDTVSVQKIALLCRKMIEDGIVAKGKSEDGKRTVYYFA